MTFALVCGIIQKTTYNGTKYRKGVIMKNFKRFFTLVIAAILIVSAIPIINSDAKTDYLSSFKVSKKTIYKGNGVVISVDKATKGSRYVDITFVVKNNSDKDYDIAAHEYAINNLMAGGSTYMSDVNVPSGKKARFTVSINKEWFKNNGIKTFKKFDVLFWGYGESMKEWESPKVSFSTNKDNGKGYFKPKKAAKVSDENIDIGYISKKSDKYKFYVKNKTERERRWTVENCSVNGWSFDLGSAKYDLYSEPILNGCYAVFEIPVDKDFKSENSIKKIKEIEFDIEFEGGFDDDYNNIEEIKSDKIKIKL
jgi:hypothetical protein